MINVGSGWIGSSLDLAGVLAGTGIAVVTRVNKDQKREVAVFYQAKDLTLRGHVYDRGWGSGQSTVEPMEYHPPNSWPKHHKGTFNPKEATGRTPIGATVINTGEIQVYWRDVVGRLAFSRKPDDKWSEPGFIAGIVPGFEIAAVGWETTKNVRVYVQDCTGMISELRSGNSGSTWSNPNVVVAGSNP